MWETPSWLSHSRHDDSVALLLCWEVIPAHSSWPLFLLLNPHGLVPQFLEVDMASTGLYLCIL